MDDRQRRAINWRTIEGGEDNCLRREGNFFDKEGTSTILGGGNVDRHLSRGL